MSGNPNGRRNIGHSNMYRDDPPPYGWEEDIPPGYYSSNSPPRYFRDYPSVTEPTGGSRRRESSFQDWPFPPPTPRSRAPQSSSYGTTLHPRNSSGSGMQYYSTGMGDSGAGAGVTIGRSGGMYATSGSPLASSMYSPHSSYRNPYDVYDGQQTSGRSSYANGYSPYGYGYAGGESAARRAYLDSLEPPSEEQQAPARRRRPNRRRNTNGPDPLRLNPPTPPPGLSGPGY